MPSITESLVGPLQSTLSLVRGVETGTFRGDGLRRLAKFLPEAISIELSPRYFTVASEATADLPNALVMQGHSAEVIPTLVDPNKPTLWFLDGHWSTLDTAGADDQCPVMREIPAIAGGHPDDVIVVDDARLFLVTAPPPQDPAQWPTLLQIIDALRAVHPGHHVTVINDQIISVPPRARAALDSYAASPDVRVLPLPVAVRSVARAVKHMKFTIPGRMR